VTYYWQLNSEYNGSQCSKHLAFLLSSHPVWHLTLQQYITSGIPLVPLHESIRDLSTKDLASVIVQSARLHRSWTSKLPKRVHVVHFTPPPHPNGQERKPLRLEILKDENRRHVLIGYLSSGNRDDSGRHVLYCIDIGEPGSRVLTAHACARMELPYIIHLVVNEATGFDAMFAVSHVDDPDSQ
jgi:hypothetical protein